MPFNPLGLQPVIRDGIRGEGLVTHSAAGPDSSGYGENKGYTGGFHRFTATTRMIVRVPGKPPSYVSPQRLASRAKYAVTGMRLPLTLSRDLRRLRIEWDEAPTIDELIEHGEMFTDPDAVAAELEAAWAEVAKYVGGDAPRRMPRPPIDGPSARVLAVGHGANDHETLIGKWELLLSVAEPGKPRYGYRWRKRIPRNTVVLPGTEIPVEIDGDEVQIPWERIRSVWSFAGAAAPTPAPAPGTPASAPPAPDPLALLKRLGQLRDAGVLSEAEFAAEKARVLGEV